MLSGSVDLRAHAGLQELVLHDNQLKQVRWMLLCLQKSTQQHALFPLSYRLPIPL
jgi:hypothetical protein